MRTDGEGRAYAAHSVIVKYERGATTAAERGLLERAAGVVDRLGSVGATGARVLAVRGDAARAAERLGGRPGVEYAEPDYVARTMATPNDPRFGELWGLQNTGQTGGTPGADISAPQGWSALGLGAFPNGGGTKVGIVDTGIRRDHPDLAGKTADCGGVRSFGTNLFLVVVGANPTIDEGRCDDGNGHGTHVAGTISANANNGVGVTGVAFNSPLAVCKGLSNSGSGTHAMIANCITWLVDRGARVISLSLGGPSSQTLQSAVQSATASGSLLIAAAGNSGGSGVEYPAGYPQVVSVAATDHNDQRASFSTFNSSVEVSAPGVNILSTWHNGGYTTASGTSMATPHAAGVAAHIVSRNPGGSVSAWRTKLQQSVDDLGPAGRDPQFGFGRVNLAKAAQ